VGAILFFFLNSQRSPLAPEEPAPRVVVNTATDNTATAGTTIDRAAEARVTEPQRTSVKPRPAAVRPAPARRPDPIESRLASTAEAEYVVAIDRLLQDVRRRRERIDPELLARLDLALVSIDYTIEATRKAVKEYPDDPEALQYMLMAYSSKMDVLKEMASL
jgi:hypothetical protein